MSKTTDLNKLTKAALIKLVRSQQRRIEADRLRLAELTTVPKPPDLRTAIEAGARVQIAVHRRHVIERDLTEAAFVAALDKLPAPPSEATRKLLDTPNALPEG